MSQPYQPTVHRFAVLTACAVLLPIGVGALVTTMRWGMAFLDWPTSDGENMLLYDWFGSFASPDKFTEHGHRLAGMLIGFLSIGLAATALWKEPRRWVKILAVAILLAVIVQGILGGMRVLENDPYFAMFHGAFAALVFTLMAATAQFTSPKWHVAEETARGVEVRHLKPLAIVTPLAILGQYALGGLVRHIGTAVYEHVGMAFVALFFVIATVVAAHRSRVSWLRSAAYAMLAVAVTQICLGIGAYITKFGLQAIGYVAVQYSTPQVILRTSHTVVGMLLFMTSVIFAIRVFRLDALASRQSVAERKAQSTSIPAVLQAEGGRR